MLQIELETSLFSYGRVLGDIFAGFHDYYTAKPVMASEVLGKEVKYVLTFHDTAKERGDWKIIANAPVEEKLQSPYWYCHQDKTSVDLQPGCPRTATRVNEQRAEHRGLLRRNSQDAQVRRIEWRCAQDRSRQGCQLG
ncbi:hypothetical protein [Roseibium sp. MMSF_3412]|uniref:hypothetical protein n=1 Tax=Roseibium sp. MMSF_3412 TaxID=3046712 RepID=UPI0034DF2C55